MRVSTLKDDPGYRRDACRFKVFLDGCFLEDCHTADEELGKAAVYAYDSNGDLIRDPKTGNLFSICLEGEVIIAAGVA